MTRSRGHGGRQQQQRRQIRYDDQHDDYAAEGVADVLKILRRWRKNGLRKTREKRPFRQSFKNDITYIIIYRLIMFIIISLS